MAGALKGLIRLYQVTLSPIFGGGCRFQPSCSAYALQAIEMHGTTRGTQLAMKRLLKCRPLGPAGYDPVPEFEQGGPGDGR